MSRDANSRATLLDLPALERIETACLEFESAWQRGDEPCVEDYLYEGETCERSELLRELLLLDLDYQLRSGKTPSQAEFQSRFPSDSELIGDVFDCFPIDDSTTQQIREVRSINVPIKEPPLQLDDYEMLELLGEGGMGAVYRAQQKSIQRIVALKVIRPDCLLLHADQQSDVKARFKAEVQAAARLEHPHIVQIYESGEVEGRPYFCMRFIDGQTLDQHLKAGPMEGRLAAALMATVAEAVEYAHQQGVVHRDLKPRNILIDKKGQPFITDFGLARSMDDDSLLTQTGEILGTPSYMSPEQAKGESELGPRTDVYSLGATFYELLTGRAPFRAAGTFETIRQVIEDQPAPPRRLNPAIDRDAETIALKCLEKDPDARYATALELREELTRYVEGRSIRARPVSQVTSGWRWCRRNPLVATLATVAAALLVALAVGGPIASIRLSTLLDRAEQGESEAIEQRDLAKKNENRAELQRQRAVAAEATALAQAKAERRKTYIADMKRVERFYGISELAVVKEILERYLPQPMQEDLRAFEWYYWWRMSHRELHSFSFEQPVQRVALHPNGLQMASAEKGGKVTVVDLESGQVLQSFQLENEDCADLRYSTDGELLAAAGAQGIVRVWNVGTGEREFRGSYPRQTLYRHTVAFDDSCRFYAWTFSENLGLTDRRKKQALWAIPSGISGVVQYSSGNSMSMHVPSLSMARQAMRESNELRKETGFDGTPESLDKLTSAQRKVLENHTRATTSFAMPTLSVAETRSNVRSRGGPVFSVALSSDSTLVAAAGAGGVVKVFDAETHEERQTVSSEAENLYSVAFTGEAKRLAACGAEGFTGAWELESGRLLNRFFGHTGDVNGIVLFSGGELIATCGDDRTVRIWDIENGECLALLKGHSATINSVVASQDNETLATAGSDRTAKVWPAYPADSQVLSRESDSMTLGCKFSPTGDSLAWISRDSNNVDTIKLWDLKKRVQTGTETLSMRFYRDLPDVVSFAPDESTLDTSITRRKLTRDQFTPGQPLTFQGSFGGRGRLRQQHSAQPIGPGTYIPNSSKMVFAGLTDGLILFEEGEPLQSSADHCLYVSASSDGSTLAAAANHSVQLWNLGDRSLRRTLEGHEDYVRCVAFSGDGKLIASASSDSTTKLWNVVTGELHKTLRGHEGGVSWVDFTPDGKTIATAGRDATIRIWDCDTGNEKTVLRGHDAWVTSLDFSPDGNTLASTSHDGTVRIWNGSRHGLENGINIATD